MNDSNNRKPTSAFSAHPRLQVAVPKKLQEAAVTAHPRLQVAIPKKFAE